MARYDNQRNPSSMNVPSELTPYERNQIGRNARNVEMNQNDNIENGVGIENNPILMAIKALGTGTQAEEGTDWLNMGQWGESLGQSVQDLPENIKGILGWLWNAGVGGSNQEPIDINNPPTWPSKIPRDDKWSS